MRFTSMYFDSSIVLMAPTEQHKANKRLPITQDIFNHFTKIDKCRLVEYQMGGGVPVV